MTGLLIKEAGLKQTQLYKVCRSTELLPLGR